MRISRAFAQCAVLCPLLFVSGLSPAASAQVLYAPWEAVPNETVAIVAPNPRGSAPSMRRLWIASAVAFAVATSLDAHSSWGKQEANTVLRGGQGQFGARAVALKTGVNGAWLVAQIFACRKSHAHRAFAIANLAAASLFALAAVHNYGVPK